MFTIFYRPGAKSKFKDKRALVALQRGEIQEMNENVVMMRQFNKNATERAMKIWFKNIPWQ